MQIVEPSQQALEITHPVAVGVHICADGEAIDDAVLVPKVIDHADVSSWSSLAGRLIAGE